MSASTLKQCQEACEFYYRCVAIDWKFSQGWVCALITYPNHEHSEESHIYSTHYELVSRCNIASGYYVVFLFTIIKLLFFDNACMKTMHMGDSEGWGKTNTEGKYGIAPSAHMHEIIDCFTK